MASGLAQVLAPIITVAGASAIAIWQQRAIASREKATRTRESKAARASLPLTLSRIEREITNALRLVRSIHPGEEALYTSNLEPPILAVKDDIFSISNCIRLNEKDSESLTYLVSKLQIVQSRLEGLLRHDSDFEIKMGTQFDQMLYDLLFLRVLIARFYDYGRLREDDIDISVSDAQMTTETRLAGFDGEYYSGLEKLIKLRAFVERPPKRRLFFRRRI